MAAVGMFGHRAYDIGVPCRRLLWMLFDHCSNFSLDLFRQRFL